MELPGRKVTILLNCIAKKRPVAVWDDIEISANADPQAIARCGLQFWYKEREGDLEPLVIDDPNCLVPDEIVIRAQQGEVLARWNIVNELNARWHESHQP